MKKKQIPILILCFSLCLALLICPKHSVKLNNGILLENIEALSRQVETSDDAQCIGSGNVKCLYGPRMVKTNVTYRLDKKDYMY